MLLQRAVKLGYNCQLSVPYFTGFVMLRIRGEIESLREQLPFSPLFYGIRDVTEYQKRFQRDIETFSPLFYGIRDVTHPAGHVKRNDAVFQSPILLDS